MDTERARDLHNPLYRKVARPTPDPAARARPVCSVVWARVRRSCAVRKKRGRGKAVEVRLFFQNARPPPPHARHVSCLHVSAKFNYNIPHTRRSAQHAQHAHALSRSSTLRFSVRLSRVVCVTVTYRKFSESSRAGPRPASWGRSGLIGRAAERRRRRSSSGARRSAAARRRRRC